MTSQQVGIVLTIVAHEDVHLSIVKQKGDWGDAYQKKAAVVRLSRADLEKLALKDGAKVEMSTAAGSVVVTARSDATGEPGVGFMPSSLHTNRLKSYDPGSAISPGKHIEARVMPAEKGITLVAGLIVRRNRA